MARDEITPKFFKQAGADLIVQLVMNTHVQWLLHMQGDTI